ncbi:MAG: hypothetical protein BZ138_05860 [Methanosphaera sp. rholeuAM270]|nr:MAG: hypothetical protein BZ138_05860 [Methanosphaera sp. rholeuAM270]
MTYKLFRKIKFIQFKIFESEKLEEVESHLRYILETQDVNPRDFTISGCDYHYYDELECDLDE